MMTPKVVQKRVDAIQERAWDNEAAHVMEDHLYRNLLGAIAKNECEHPEECAKIALTTKDIAFRRWYA